jgi:hypothetical protein
LHACTFVFLSIAKIDEIPLAFQAEQWNSDIVKKDFVSIGFIDFATVLWLLVEGFVFCYTALCFWAFHP